MKNFLQFILVLLSPAFLCAQTLISGKIIDKATGEGLIGAAVLIENTTRGNITDIDGNYSIPVEAGTYTLVISFVSYQPAKVEVTVKPNEVAYVNYAMEELKTLMTEVVIVAKAERTGTVAMMIERKKAAQVSDGVSADLIRKTPDRTTSDVLKRVTGASIQEGKFAVIRGMNDRYNLGYLDGALLPSTEADRKAFAFDVVPANLIDNLTILKAASPDLAGDFGGGVIKINTKAVPEKFTQSLTIGVQTHSLTTFKDFRQYTRYGGEAFNLVSSKRDLPTFGDSELRAGAFLSNEDKNRLANVSKQFNNDWSSSVVSAAPNSRFAYSIGLPIKLSDTKKLGFILALNYADTRRVAEGNVNSFSDAGQVAGFNDKVNYRNTTFGGILNMSYVSTKTQVNFRNLLNTNMDDNTTERTGSADLIDNLEVQNRSNILNYNRLYNSIVSLKQVFGEKALILNASIGYSNVRRRIPDYRNSSYTRLSGLPTFSLSTNDFFNSGSGRFSSDLTENLLNGNIDLSKQFDTKSIKTEIKIGYTNQVRDREFSGRSFVFNGKSGDNTLDPAVDLGAKNIAADKLVYVERTSDGLAYYTGNSTISGYYLSVDNNFNDKLRAVYGVRYENADIKVDNQKTKAAISRINQGDFLPSVNLTYYLSEKVNIRASYFASLNRPEFRELAPFAFFVFDKNAEIKGNDTLRIAKLNNFDLRFEYYPSGGQIFSIGGFYKTISNPIEFAIDLAQPFTTFTYQNEKSANIYGIEMEVKKNFDFLGESKVFSEMAMFGNLALIKSSLSFNADSRATPNRTLQGQSPFILNFGLQYESADNGWFGSIVANRIGRRIAFVGADKQFGPFRRDIYEAPRNVVDVQFGKNIKKLNIKLTLGDILRNNSVFYQDVNADGTYTKGTNVNDSDYLMFFYNNGFTAALSVGYTF